MSESVRTHTGVSVPLLCRVLLFLRLLLIVFFQDAKLGFYLIRRRIFDEMKR